MKKKYINFLVNIDLLCKQTINNNNNSLNCIVESAIQIKKTNFPNITLKFEKYIATKLYSIIFAAM